MRARNESESDRDIMAEAAAALSVISLMLISDFTSPSTFVDRRICNPTPC